MTEKEKMLCGTFYDTRDSELRRLSNRAKDLMRIYNNLPAENICCLAFAAKMPVSISRFGWITAAISLSVREALSI